MAKEPVFSRLQLSRVLQASSDCDVWSNLVECVDDLIDEIEENWEKVDDEVWAQVVLMEKNTKIESILLRKPKVVISNGVESKDHESHSIVGLAGFKKKLKNEATSSYLKKIQEGLQIEMDSGGNIVASNVSPEALCYKQVSDDDIKEVRDRKPFKLFDMKRFQMLTKKELKKDSPDWDKLRVASVTSLSFGEQNIECLDQPFWILLINVVALDFLRSRRSSLISNLSISSSSTFTCEDETSRSSGKKEVKGKDDLKGKILGHPMTWHTMPPVPPVRQASSRLI